jgi:hypothetical protein
MRSAAGNRDPDGKCHKRTIRQAEKSTPGRQACSLLVFGMVLCVRRKSRLAEGLRQPVTVEMN